MKKQDEIEFFWYLINNSEISEWSGYIHPGRDKIELFNMHDKRKMYLLEKCKSTLKFDATTGCAKKLPPEWRSRAGIEHGALESENSIISR